MPGITTQNVPTSLGQFHPNTTTSCKLIPLIARNTAEMGLQDYQEATVVPVGLHFLKFDHQRNLTHIPPPLLLCGMGHI